jgi:2-C-methyl-D-erythritol 4-phosphate cytidylyltransferase/2-C-methyl-D-erythritol 2,4-cyclodiphosphate synthase
MQTDVYHGLFRVQVEVHLETETPWSSRFRHRVTRYNQRLPDQLVVTAIIAAGGRGRRLGAASPKQLLQVGGREILERSVTAFLEHPGVHDVIVALPADVAAEPPAYLRRTAKPLTVVVGGVRRQDSVANAFQQVDSRTAVVVVHDAARPFVSADLIARTIAAAAESGAALAALPARDTVKLAGRSEDGLFVRETLPRESIFLAQTPQAFRRGILGDALASAAEATDEAALAERLGHRVRLVEGEATNIKITGPEDLTIAEAIAQGRHDTMTQPAKPARTGRAGTGYDLHRLVPGRPLVIGGVTIASDRGALGHSDADVVCHAIIDAMLGAACLGDIGQHFPDSDPRWKDASSLDLLAHATRLVAEQELIAGNVDVTVILEAPKIRHAVDAMRAAVAAAIGIDASRVSIKAKTNEGVDAVGRGEAIAAHAVALLRQR